MQDIDRLKHELYYQVLSMTSKKDDTQIVYTLARVEDLINMIIKYSTRAGVKGDNMTFEIWVKEKVLDDGRKFNTYTTIERHFATKHTFFPVKFTKEVVELPSQHCLIEVERDDWNCSTKEERPVIWIKAIKSITNLD